MRDHPNLDYARRLWDAAAEGDADALRELLTDDVAWRVRGSHPLSGDYQGPEGVLHYLASVGEQADELFEESGLDPALHAGKTFYEGAGCFECNGTGFFGRTAISELLDLSDRIRELILERRPASEIKRAAHEEGMTFLRESALEKVFEGVTTLREINKVTFVD